MKGEILRGSGGLKAIGAVRKMLSCRPCTHIAPWGVEVAKVGLSRWICLN